MHSSEVRGKSRRPSAGRRPAKIAELAKARSGIRGLDEITGGGLPRGRPTLVCGAAGCGKTLFAMEFLVRGAIDFGEPGVFMAFEETAEELATNVASLGFDLKRLQDEKKLVIDYVRVERSEIEETGEYDLEGLFVRLAAAIESVGAKRVVLDTIESLFAGLPGPMIVRSELRRLFRWLKDHGMTVVVTGEKGDGSLTRQGIEEYVSDCVVVLDHRIVDQTSTRRIRIAKYRGALHGTNEYPFLIDDGGISIVPVTSMALDHRASRKHVSSGVERLDEMLGSDGYYVGSTVLVTGTAGTGKSSLAAHFAKAACMRGETCLFFAFEESTDQLVRNMASIGIDLAPEIDAGRLVVLPSRPTAHGLERHLVEMHRAVELHAPDVVVIDPISNLVEVGSPRETRAMITRLIDYLKTRQVTTLFTTLVGGGSDLEQTEVGISSLVDSWISLQVVRSGGERNRTLSVVKSRGMAHSNQAAEFLLTEDGLTLVDTYLGTEVRTGSARLAKEAEDAAAIDSQAEEIARKKEERARKRKALNRRIAELGEEFEAQDATIAQEIESVVRRRERLRSERNAMAASRRAFAATPKNGHAKGARR